VCFACADERAAAWKGHNLDDLIRAWGPPSASATLRDGTTIAEWTYGRVVPGVPPYTRPHSQECKPTITADKDNIITATKVVGSLGGCNSMFRDKEAPRA
jgi:hypothetical protein